MLRLKELRGTKTMKDTARDLGMPYTTYIGYEKEQRTMPPDTMRQIADHYGVSVDYLLGYSETSDRDSDFQAGFNLIIGDTPGARLSRAMNGLNDAGWEKVIEYATDLNDNKKYTR